MNKTEERKNEINGVLENLRSMFEEAVDIAAKQEEEAWNRKLVSNKNVVLEDENKKLERNNTELLKDQSKLIDRVNALTIGEEAMFADIKDLCAICDDWCHKCEALTEERDNVQEKFDNQEKNYRESIRKREKLMEQLDSLEFLRTLLKNIYYGDFDEQQRGDFT